MGQLEVLEEVRVQVPVRDSFLVLGWIQRLSRGWRAERVLLVGIICILHLGACLLQEELNHDLGEIGGIVMIYKLYNVTMNAKRKRKREDWV